VIGLALIIHEVRLIYLTGNISDILGGIGMYVLFSGLALSSKSWWGLVFLLLVLF
jgi:hypothetical protein